MRLAILLFCLLTLSFFVSQNAYGEGNKSDSTRVSDSIPSQYELIPLHTKPPASSRLLRHKKDPLGLWINDNKWIKASLGLNPESIFEFEHIDGEVQALLLFNKDRITLKELKSVAIANAKKAARDSKVVFMETRIVNGTEILCMRIDGTIDTVPFTYYGYYYAGYIGNIQLITILSPSLFDEHKRDLDDFLDGLEIFK